MKVRTQPSRFHSVEQFAAALLHTKNLDVFLESLLAGLKKTFGAERATFYFFNDQAQELWSYVATDLEIGNVRVRLGEGIAGRAAKEKKVIRVKDAHTCSFFKSSIDKKTGFRTRSVLVAPLLDQNRKLVGAVQLLNKKHGFFTLEDAQLLASFSGYIVVALDNMRFLEERQALLRSTMYALTGAIDAKDPVTVGHSYRVTYYALKMARALHLGEQDIDTLEYASYLHDVGKIGISDMVLQKKERLTADEFAIIRKHPEFTKQILRNIIFSPENRNIPDIAGSHHEFLDGSGYPAKLRGDQINILSRIIAVADIYDALVSFDRPYKKHLTASQACAILQEEVTKGHLDKKIVSLFIDKGLYHYEMRRHERIAARVDVDYHVIPQRRVFREGIARNQQGTLADLPVMGGIAGVSLNISGGGIFIEPKQYLPIGTYLDITVAISSWKLRCIGKIVWVQKMQGKVGYRAGVSFMNISEKLKDILAKKINLLSSG